MSPSLYASAIVVNLLGLVLPLTMLQIYDRVIPNVAEATLSALVGVLLVTTLIEGTLRVSRIYIDGFNAAKFSLNVTSDAFDRLLTSNLLELQAEPTRKTIDRLDAIARLGSFFGGPARQIFVDLPFSIVFIVAIAVVGGWLVVIPIAISIGFAIIVFYWGSTLERLVETKDAQDTRVFDFISEVLSGISTVKGLATEQFMCRRFERLWRASAVSTFNLISTSDRAQIMAATLGNITTIAVASFGAVLALDGSITVGTLAASSLLSGRAIQPILRIAGVWNEYQRTRLTLREASKVFSVPASSSIGRRAILDRPPEISLTSVGCHLGKDKHAFRNISMVINPGDIVSFCGPNGVGKTSILKLISGQQQPDSGVIQIAGCSAREFRQKYSNSIGHVSPETSVFHGSIIENLTLFGTGCDQQQALQAAQLLGLEEEIYRFPGGYSTELGRAAVETLPKAFIQRILIARAVAQRPRVLILDEAQAYLDTRSDAILREALMDLKFSTTIILVTNRPEYTLLADQVFDFSTGQIKRRHTPKLPVSASVQ